jgi:hypothetical protein
LLVTHAVAGEVKQQQVVARLAGEEARDGPANAVLGLVEELGDRVERADLLRL